MRTRTAVATSAVVLCGLAWAQAGERLSDPQVAQLVAGLDRGFDVWKGDLERRKVDDVVLRSSTGTVDVKKFLKDLEDDIDLVKDRLDSSYAAGPEVTALLRRASDVERRYQREGTPEAWKTLGGQLSELARVYGLGWPVDVSANALRKMDRELAVEAKRVADAADPLRKGALRAASDAKRPKPERDEADRAMRELKQAAQQLESDLKAHRAIAADAARVRDLSGKAMAFARGAGTLPPEAASAMGTMQAATEVIAIAFGRP
jgi:hypothetical protein